MSCPGESPILVRFTLRSTEGKADDAVVLHPGEATLPVILAYVESGRTVVLAPLDDPGDMQEPRAGNSGPGLR